MTGKRKSPISPKKTSDFLPISANVARLGLFLFFEGETGADQTTLASWTRSVRRHLRLNRLAAEEALFLH
jgi:hypothetical protein